MAFRWRANAGPTLNAGLVVLYKPYIFVILRGGPDPLYPPLDPHKTIPSWIEINIVQNCNI